MLATAVLAIAVLFSGTALAISLRWHKQLIEYFKPSEKQIQTLDGAVNMPEATVTQNGVTVTIKQTLADAFGIYVLYEMTVPDDIELNDHIGWDLEFLDVPTVKTEEFTSVPMVRKFWSRQEIRGRCCITLKQQQLSKAEI